MNSLYSACSLLLRSKLDEPLAIEEAINLKKLLAKVGSPEIALGERPDVPLAPQKGPSFMASEYEFSLPPREEFAL